jgi:hypothetical protein
VYGNYMGYLDFSGIRYFDVRNNNDIYYEIYPGNSDLESDSTRRVDAITLASGNDELA